MTCVPAVKVSQRVKKKQKAREKLNENEGPPSVLLEVMARPQKNASLKAKERKKKK